MLADENGRLWVKPQPHFANRGQVARIGQGGLVKHPCLCVGQTHAEFSRQLRHQIGIAVQVVPVSHAGFFRQGRTGKLGS